MSVDINSQDAHALRKLAPISTLSSAHFEALCTEIEIEKQSPGFVLFKRGDSEKDYVYLIEGEISLQSPEFCIETVSAHDEPVRFPLAHQIPRKIDAVALTPIRFCRVKVDSINTPSEVYYKYEEEDSGYSVTNETEPNSDDWMTALLSSPVFQRLPAANLQKVLMTMETVEYKRGETIIKQGDEGDYYYFIRQGICLLTRKPAPNAKDIKLAQLHKYESFGEDALISGNQREATAIAASDVAVLRMDKEKFNALIKEPIMNYVDFATAQQALQEQAAILLDVRDPDSYNALHVGGSQNMPFFSLRMLLKTLDRERKIILICMDGKLSEAAAFLLIKSGFNASIVKGGIKKIPQEFLIGTQTAVADNGGNAIDRVSEEAAEVSVKHPSPVGDGLLEALKAENEALKGDLEQLQQQYQALIVDKQKLEKNFRLLVAQTEKLKDMLRKPQTGGQSSGA
ncbi:MAG: cyclic nucleotide-binding domain-containing protein [Gammaproteobacteria bacterium]